MNNNARYDKSVQTLELEANVPRTIGILRNEYIGQEVKDVWPAVNVTIVDHRDYSI